MAEKRLVDAMKIVTRLSKRISVLILLGGTPAEVYAEVLKVIAEAPTEDAAPVVHGRVITTTDKQKVFHQNCSECGEELVWKSYPKFCNNCGAKLDKEECE